MIRAALTILIASTVTAQTPALAGGPKLIDHPRKPGLAERARSQRLNLAHSRYVCMHGGGLNKRWHCKALHWLRHEYAETEKTIALKEQERELQQLYQAGPTEAIKAAFGSYWQQAVTVARCESGLTTTAQNGQYLGLFQMGSNERALYGHGATAWEQARAANRYFVASGRDWSPWSCKPW